MNIRHHPDAATLMSYAAGTLPEALAAVIASHASLCPSCRSDISRMERLGAVLLSSLGREGAQVDGGGAISAGALLDRDGPLRHEKEAGVRAVHRELLSAGAGDAECSCDVPAPLRPLVGATLDDVAWRRLGYGIWHCPLPVSGSDSGDLRLLKIGAGLAMPEHGHGGIELTLVLRGSYSDETGTYRAGDLADLDEDIEHRPITDVEQGCICLIASEKRARFKTLFGRMVQPLTGL